MNEIHLNHEYALLMKKAEQATNRQDALDCIHRATALRAAMNVLKSNPPDDRYSRWCGGKNGFDDYAERLH
jgi:hypothetical protein